jgi:hypothetical protein
MEGWLRWQIAEQLPAILRTGLFDSYQLYRLLEQDEEEGPSFVIQLFTSNLERYEEFLIGFAPEIQQSARDKWGDGFIAFRTLMEQIR